MKVLVVYESTLGRTKAMAHAICEGVVASGVECSAIEARDYTGLEGFCALAIGSSTRMKRPLPRVRQILSEISGMNGMPSASFGSYGWSGEAPEEIAKILVERGAVMIAAPLRCKDYPNEEALASCRELGRRLAQACDR
ncbi:MAG: FprA family A-type flavoprotein [Candidatus Thorarchaeota archaeon]|nr:FprA family A-type flavoprotein [Candidatus Thorarchaeota archaeon]